MSLILHVDSQYASPYAMSAFIALTEKRLPFSLQTVDLGAGQQALTDYAAISLTRRVPTLEHDDFALSESSAIAEYLDEAFPAGRIYPADRQQRARARQLQAWLRSDLFALREERNTLVVFYRPVATPLSERAQQDAAKLCAVAKSLLAEDAANLFGEWCLADVELALMLNRLRLNGDALPAPLAAYAERQWQRPSLRQWLDLPRPALLA